VFFWCGVIVGAYYLCFRKKKNTYYENEESFLDRGNRPIIPKKIFKNKNENILSIEAAPRALTRSSIKPRFDDKETKFILYHQNFFVLDNNDQSNDINQPILRFIRETDNSELLEANLYTYSFHPALFFKVFFINLLYAFGIGIILVPLYVCFFKSTFISNTKLYHTQILVAFMGVFSLIYVVYKTCTGELLEITQENLEYFEGLLFFCLLNASTAAYINDKIAILLETYLLKQTKDNRFQWSYDITNKDEVDATFLRLNIDASMFYLTFFKETPQIYKRNYQDHNEKKIELGDDVQENMVVDERYPYIYYHKPVNPCDLLEIIPSFEKSLFKFKFLTRPSRYDSERAFGYTLALNMSKYVSDARGLNKFIGVVSIINYLMFFAFSISSTFAEYEKKQAPLDIFGWLRLLMWFIMNLLPRGIIVYATIGAVSIITLKFNHLQELYNMINVEKENTSEILDKEYPILNILDFTTLKSWISLRKVFMHLNEQRLERTTLALAIFMIYEIITLLIMALYYFGILPQSTGTDYVKFMKFYATECSLFLITFFILVFYGAKVNDQYDQHKNLINRNRSTVINIFRLYPSMIGENSVKPGTFIYNQGLRMLKQEFGEDFSQVKFDEKLRVLVETYDCMLQDLEYEEKHYPFKLFGMAVRGTFVKSLGTLIFSLLTPMLKNLLVYFNPQN